jgi:lipopolysaccharide transport system ATP-binding protein
MSEVALRVENVSKLYRLGHVGTGTLRSDINRLFHRIRGKEDPYLKIGQENDRTKSADSEYVWALKDINFEVGKGEVLGIIGRNGAGKSTLLKILSKITSPTTGAISINGRVASLLEVGTGFHPDLSGRENIYLNGSILGMRKWEIQRKFDEIVDFSGVERYIDTPVKRYSSGMYVRLAFAVAAHLEPEILIIDEVLAVGDAEFQKKCLGKMKDVSVEGRTVLFVSHNMAAVKSLCTHGIVLMNGKLRFDGDATSAVSYYLKGGEENLQNSKTFQNIGLEGVFQLHGIDICSQGATVHDPLLENKPIELITKIRINALDASRYHVTYHLYNEMGEALFSFANTEDATLRNGENELKCIFPANYFQSGNYYLSLFFVEDKRRSIFIEKDIISFTVVDGGRELGVYMGREPGFIRPVFEWQNP